jgi:outer membrane immunogenic protein
MKKITLILSALLLSAFTFAQSTGEAPLSKGQKQLNLGLGFSNSGIPTYVGLDIAVHNDVTVGPVLKVIFDDSDVYVTAIGRGDYHFNRLLNISNNWDVYAGAAIGVRFGHGADLDLGLQIGGRYYWSEKWALNLEFGGGTGYGTSLGVSMKF